MLPTLIRKYLDLLTLDRLNILFLSQTLEKDCTLTEEIYGIKYFKEKIDITEEEINSYNNCKDNLDYPPENKFIPKDLSIFPTPENVGEYPEKIMESKNCEVWFLQDKIFKKPTAYLIIQFSIPFDICNFSEIKNRILFVLLEKVVVQELGEILYMATEANVNFSFSANNSKVQIVYSGAKKLLNYNPKKY